MLIPLLMWRLAGGRDAVRALRPRFGRRDVVVMGTGALMLFCSHALIPIRLADDTRILFLLTISVSIPEEFFFRGWVQDQLESAWGARLGIAVSVLAFASFHIQRHFMPLLDGDRPDRYVTLCLSVAMFMMTSLLLARTYRATGNLWSNIVLHTCWNHFMFTRDMLR